MAGKVTYPQRTLGVKDVEINTRFYPNFTSPVTMATGVKPRRGITSIVRSAAGTWTITLDDRYYSLSSCTATRMGANAAGVFRVGYCSDTISGYTGAGTVLSLVHEISGTATDIVAASTNAVLLKLTFGDSKEGN